MDKRTRAWHGRTKPIRLKAFALIVVGFLLAWCLLPLLGCAGAQMPAGEPDPCMPAQGPVLTRDEPGCRVGSLLDTAEAKVERGEGVVEECAEMHVLIPLVPEVGERVLLWAMLASVEGESGLLCEGTVVRAYADAKLMREERDQRGARNFVRGVDMECRQAADKQRIRRFPQ